MRGHDGLTWQERRRFKQFAEQIRSHFFMDCPKHGEDVPIHPYSDGCFYCVEEESTDAPSEEPPDTFVEALEESIFTLCDVSCQDASYCRDYGCIRAANDAAEDTSGPG